MPKIVEKPEDYFRKLIPPRNKLMLELEAQAEKEDIPIVGPVMGELLGILASVTGAGRILELGTATGYSAIYLAKGCEAVDGIVVTLETDTDMAARAQQNFKKAGVSDRIKIHVANALEVLPQWQEGFDMIFLDIEKHNYIKLLPDCQRLLKTRGLLVADNVGFKDADEFNQAIAQNDAWKSVPVFAFLPLHSPEHDAFSLAVKC